VLLIFGVCAGVAVLVITAAMFWLGIKALGTRGDRAAANQMLQLAAVLLGGRFRDRHEYPWYRRPAQYGTIEGELCELGYELYLMPWNAEDCGGAAMLQIRSQQGRPLPGQGPGLRVFIPERVWHWPDLADPGTLADHVSQAIATVESGGLPPAAPGHRSNRH
jgi:hypothetical protein